MRTALTVVAFVGGTVSCAGSGEPVASPTLAETTSTSQASTQPSEKSSTASAHEPVTIEVALDAIGADCDMPPHCTWRGTTFSLDIPADWQQSADLRQQACDQGYVNTGYLIATDGESWFAAAAYNEDTRALASALQTAGLNAEVQGYCG
jgi:hypothetical protein